MTKQTPPPISGVLLAGGKSRRMGCDKAAILFRGVPLWRCQLAILRGAGVSELFISGPAAGAYAASGVPIIGDEITGKGPLAGIAAALGRIKNEYATVLAVDMPLMAPSFLRELSKVALRAACSVIPRRDGKMFEPLAAVYRRNALPRIHAHLRSADRSLQRVVNALIADGLAIAHEIDPREEHYFANINTAGDLDQVASAGA
jgi:molybdopterin-guanine dinucleotide biosynthesis protein A